MKNNMDEKLNNLFELLEDFYNRFHHREMVHPDPLEFLYNYNDIKDREIAGLIASSLAYGQVKQILKSVNKVLINLGSPYESLMNYDYKELNNKFKNFKHRFSVKDELLCLLVGIKKIITRYGSIENGIVRHIKNEDTNILPALRNFAIELNIYNSLIPDPSKGSACKRLNLYLRWMVREDSVDPGGWKKIKPSLLLIPLDVHMHRVSHILKFTKRKQADIKTVIEITDNFKKINPIDPVRYDFALTRPGIRKEPFFSKFL
jgi:uncharacterized protein (TIGR02757 family)